MIECEVLKENSDVCETGTKYEDIFSDHLETQANVTKLLENMFIKRKRIEENLNKS